MTLQELQKKTCCTDAELSSLIHEGLKYRRKFRSRLNRFCQQFTPVIFHGYFSTWVNGLPGLKFGRLSQSYFSDSFTIIWITFNGRGISLITPYRRFIDPLKDLL